MDLGTHEEVFDFDVSEGVDWFAVYHFVDWWGEEHFHSAADGVFDHAVFLDACVFVGCEEDGVGCVFLNDCVEFLFTGYVVGNYYIREGSTTANSKAEFEEKRINDMLRVIERLFYFRGTQEHCSRTQSEGFNHKFTMLGVDAILNMMYNGMSAKDIIAKCRKHFEPIGLYPLPKADYSMKYRMFRMLANSKCGMRMLRLILPSSKPTKR